MSGANRNHFETEPLEFCIQVLVLWMINLVHDQENGRRERRSSRASSSSIGVRPCCASTTKRMSPASRMAAFGLLRAQAAGYELPFDVDDINAAAWRELERGTMTPGDIGLMLWIDARRDGSRGQELADRLDAALRAEGGLPARLGMELGWIVTGLAHHVAAGGSATGERLLRESLDQLLGPQPRAEPPVPPLRRRAAGDGASRTSPPRSTRCSRSPSSAATASTTARCRRRAPRPTGCSSSSCPTAAGRGCSTPSAAPSSSATRSTRCTSTRWRRWGCSSSRRPPATRATATPPCAGSLDPRRQRAAAWTWSTARTAGAALDPPPPRARSRVARRQDRRVGRRPADARVDGAPDRAQPDRPPVQLRLGARGVVRPRGRGARGPLIVLETRRGGATAAPASRPTVTVDVVVVAYNSRDTLRACVEPLAALPWVKVTVVDNASPERLGCGRRRPPCRTTIRAPRNGGFAYGCNLGVGCRRGGVRAASSTRTR